jgi:hypothetical protein
MEKVARLFFFAYINSTHSNSHSARAGEGEEKKNAKRERKSER